MNKSYKLKIDHNQWKVYHWDETTKCYREGTNILSYRQACEAVKEANSSSR